ncbi:hypothetical protein [Tropicimonas sp. IMCC34043]|uniref:ATP-binding protein n=1 Tax=Tropicimonas sp. IMCC34043 TaxID=2248760 RepID=UPI000E2254BB|nr:hypothetical protein [Tropicimonas sp. IMCC34043]
MGLVLCPPSPDLLARSAPGLRLLAEAAAALGGQLELEAEHGRVGRYTAPDGRVRMLMGKALGLNSDAAAALAADKDYTARLLAAEGLPTPPGVIVVSPGFRAKMRLSNRAVAEGLPGPEVAQDFAAGAGFPVIVKPNFGNMGRGVRRAGSAAELACDLEDGFRADDRLRVEALIPGRDYRLMVLRDEVVVAYERRPLAVTGDGRQSVGALLEARLRRLTERYHGPKLALDDPRLARAIAGAGLTAATVLPAGRRVVLLANANLSTGGELVDLTGKVPAAAEALAIRAAAAIGLQVAGIDILAPDLAAGTEGACILEVNAAPGMDYYASEGPVQWARAVAFHARALSDAD